ncbi:MAG: sugar phosphate isomerase/epimerase, partial [Parapedobacter sp.]
CVIAHRYGFESVSVIIGDLMEKSDHERDALLEDMKKMKLSWGVSFLNVEYRKDKETYRKGLEQLPAMAKVLHKMGADRMMTYIMSNHDQLNYLQNFRQTATRLREIAGILADQDIRLGLEYVGPKSIWSANKFPFIHTMAETKELIAAIGQPNVGFHLDTAHWFTSGEHINDLKTLENSDIVGCDLNDAIKGITWENQPGYQRELPLATGVIDTKSFLEALVSIGYDGPVQAEPFNEVLNNMNDEQAISTTAEAMKKAFALVD